jgi:hypothetical protein
MTETERLIERLAAGAQPVRRLAPPWRRTATWLLMAAAVLVVVAAGHGLRADLAGAMADPAVRTEWLASLLVGVLAAHAAFVVSLPGRRLRWAWLPAPAAALWLAGLGWGCLRDYARLGPAALAFDPVSAECAWTITLVSLPLGLVMLLMVRHAAVVRPAATAALAALAAAALASAGVGLLHEGETMLMTLLWHAGAVAVLAGLGLASSRRLFAWIGHARAAS